jgi:digeranylgeranylglycerophospholipid reductase
VTYDVLVVGAGTAGTYFAWRMAERGYSVAVLEREAREEVGRRLDIFHLDSIRFAQFGIPEPQPGSEELVAVHSDGKAHSPDGKMAKLAEYGFHVMRLPLFLRRLHHLAEEAGVRIIDRCTFREPLLEEGRLAGARADLRGEPATFHARLTVDASGTASVVRRSLPACSGMENFPLGPGDLLYVVLRYIRWKEPRALHPRGLNFWPYYKVFCNPGYSEEEAILGVGQPGSYARSDEVLAEFLAAVPLPPYEVVKVEQGVTPYRRPPYSLVGEGFLCLGDAACITKPFSGEGITAAWTLGAIAVEEADRALRKDGVPTRAELWEINTRYFRDQGAKFAGLLAQLPGAAGVSAGEMDYLFEKDIIFNGPDITAVSRDYQLRLSPLAVARMAGWLLLGLSTGRFSFGSLRELLASVLVSDRVARHYRAFPDDPRDFDAWVARAEALWAKAGLGDWLNP